MMMKTVLSLVFCTCYCFALAQTCLSPVRRIAYPGLSIVISPPPPALSAALLRGDRVFLQPAGAPTSQLTPPPLIPFPSLADVPLHQPTLGFFCQLEVQLAQRACLPLRIRLGEFEYTERLEYGEHFRLGAKDGE